MNFKTLTPFQITIIIIFIVSGIAGFGAFAFYSAESNNQRVVITLWGPYNAGFIGSILTNQVENNNDDIDVRYQQVSYDNFDEVFTNALADGNAPDLIILPHDRIHKHLSRFYRLPFESYSERDFKDTFIEAAEIFIVDDSIVGFPITVDPLVMYWNRSLFNEAQLAIPPETWSDIISERYQRLTQRDGQLIRQSIVAFGGYENVTNAKYILAMLAMQAGTPITIRDDGQTRVVFDQKAGGGVSPAGAAVNYYSQFANPSKDIYSWNSSLPESKQAFLSTDLALYFGFASERREIIDQNPNLNFDVATVPHGDTSEVTSAKLEAIAIVNSSPRKQEALSVAFALSQPEVIELFSERYGYPPVRRDLLSNTPGEAHKAVFREAAFRSQAWLDPDPEESDQVFSQMIRFIRSGQYVPTRAIFRADQELQELL